MIPAPMEPRPSCGTSSPRARAILKLTWSPPGPATSAESLVTAALGCSAPCTQDSHGHILHQQDWNQGIRHAGNAGTEEQEPEWKHPRQLRERILVSFWRFKALASANAFFLELMEDGRHLPFAYAYGLNLFNVDPVGGIRAGVAGRTVGRLLAISAGFLQPGQRQISQRVGANELANLLH